MTCETPMTDDIAAIAALPPPPRYREKAVIPIPLYGECAQILIPKDMTELEARKIAAVVIAYAENVTTWNVRPLS